MKMLSLLFGRPQPPPPPPPRDIVNLSINLLSGRYSIVGKRVDGTVGVSWTGSSRDNAVAELALLSQRLR